MMDGQFSLQIQKFIEKAGARADDVVGEVVTNLAATVDYRSPIGDPELWLYNKGTSENPEYTHYLTYRDADGYVGGRFRANWNLSIGAPDESTSDRTDTSPKDPDRGGARTGEITAIIPEQAAGNVYYLANSLPYAQRLEDGWSTQAPNGIVSRTVVEFQSIVDDAVASAKAKLP